VIQNTCKDIKRPIVQLIKNIFYYCIKENIFFSRIKPLPIFPLDSHTSSIMATVTKRSIEDINSLFSTLIKIFSDNSSNEGTLHEIYDDLLNNEKAMRNASGF